MSIREEMQAVYDAEGRLTARLVLEAGRSGEFPALHAAFEWDDSKAAEAHRLNQAGDLIRKMKVVYHDAATGERRSVRAYLSVPVSEQLPSDYFDQEDVRTDPFKRRLVLRGMEREWKALERRYGELQEFWRLVAKAQRKKAG